MRQTKDTVNYCVPINKLLELMGDAARLFWGVTSCKIVPSFSFFIYFIYSVGDTDTSLTYLVSSLPGYGAAIARAELPVPISVSVCAVFLCIQTKWYSYQCFSFFLMCSQILVHAIVHGGCTNTVRESAPIVDPGKRVPSHAGESNLSQYCT